MSNSRRNHTREFKLQCCRQVATGEKRPAQICREHNLSESVLLRWRKEYEARGEAAFTEKQPSGDEALQARIAELERFCGQLSLENRILKKWPMALAGPPRRHENVAVAGPTSAELGAIHIRGREPVQQCDVGALRAPQTVALEHEY